MTKYKVTAPCVTHIPVPGPGGISLTTLYVDAVLPEGVDEDRIKHLLDSKLIVEVGADAQPEGVGSEETSESRTVNSRSSKAELVDHGVAQGGGRAELEKLNRDELLARYVRQQ
ncbi:hypothetical protein SAMN05216275_14163 [Streptosporangium canum]|uniref:Uncharacterized protein n=1 Tax=Streptosporangium canum TaxID=324952 RepID=A0A1I4DGK1_9ACTN|nr:hypothetical protein [Streptosporangium canum]SFK92602.1 hypothetical protein SAMN05216275_14163 [Streptosporangium canum]